MAGDGDVFYGNTDIRRAINEGFIMGPRMAVANHYLSITGGGGDLNYLSPEQTMIADGLVVDGVDAIRKAVRTKIKYGSDWVKSSPPVPICRSVTTLKMSLSALKNFRRLWMRRTVKAPQSWPMPMPPLV